MNNEAETAIKPNPYQRNFTTPEQSVRLIEMGVPVESADCYYYLGQLRMRSSEEELSKDFFHSNTLAIPCWSLGQLMDVYMRCVTWGEEDDTPSIHIYASTPSIWNGVETIVEYIQNDEMDYTVEERYMKRQEA